MFQHATLSGDALDYIEALLLDTPGPVPSDHRALSVYALLYQVCARAQALAASQRAHTVCTHICTAA